MDAGCRRTTPLAGTAEIALRPSYPSRSGSFRPVPMSDATDDPPAGTTPGPKLAQVVAGRIEADILDRKQPVGTVIGSEAELLRRHGVSRGVFREAIRLVEHKQLARMRRGPGGGLVVTEPDDGPVVDAVAVYMRFVGIRLDELFEARRIVESAATALAAASMSEHDLTALREHDDAGDLQALHRRIGELTGNPAVSLFCNVLIRLTALYVGSLRGSAAQRRRQTSDSHDAHAAIVDALVAGNAGLAAHRMESHLVGLESVLREQHASPTIVAEMLGRGGGGRAKAAEDLARTILREVADKDWPVGEVLGSEAQLIERHDVSRAVLREAVRLLEFHQVARMRRGPGGGLVVTEPGVDAVAESMALLLEYRGIGPDHLARLRASVEVAAAELAALRLDDAGRAAIEGALAAERSDGSANLNVVGHGLHLVLAEVSRNRLLHLFLTILVRVSARHTPSTITERPAGEIRADVLHAHDRIAEAVLSGDPSMARHRMLRHIEALVPYFV